MSNAGWTTGLCGCFSDCSVCCLTYWCPCITFGRIAEMVDKGQSSCCGSGCMYTCLMFIGFNWLYSCNFRSKLKAQYGMPPSTCADCCSHLFCHFCALNQEYRELRNRGFSPSKGWAANAAKSNQASGMASPPQAPEGMRR